MTRFARISPPLALFMAAHALADVPPAMDRVPANAAVVASIRNLSEFQGGVEKFVKTLEIPGAEANLGMATQLMSLPGLDPAGSAAIALIPGPEGLDLESEQGPLVAVVPVKDYAAFIQGLGGQPGGVVQIDFQGEPAYVKDLGGGFAALGPVEDMVNDFEGKVGNGKAHEKALGATGRSIAEGAQTFVMVNVEGVRPMIEQGLEGFRQNMQMVQMMAGGGDAAGFDMAQQLVDGFVRDAQTGIFGATAGEAGLSVDFAAQFKEGSVFAGYCTGKSTAGNLASRVPDLPYLFAASLDTTSPGVKQMMREAAQAQAKDQPAIAGMEFLKHIDSVDGVAFVMGTSPAGLVGGGLFVNTVQYVKTRDGAAFLKDFRGNMEAANGKTIDGMTFECKFEPGADTVDGKAVDAWSMKMTADPASPQGAQVQQMMMMMFGPAGGPSGYIAAAEGGVAITYSKKADTMAKALQAAAQGKGLGAAPTTAQVAERLPGGRSAEFYIGAKEIMQQVIQLGSFIGLGDVDMEIPQDMPPVGFAAVTDNGGGRVSVFVPSAVIKATAALQSAMEGGGMEEAPAEEPKAGKPRF